MFPIKNYCEQQYWNLSSISNISVVSALSASWLYKMTSIQAHPLQQLASALESF